VQSAEKSDYASYAQALFSVSFISVRFIVLQLSYHNWGKK